ncbi:MAG: phasin family protein, partial [Acidimicrobiales bacterium]
MAEKETWKRIIDAGLAFTQMTRERAESIIRDLVAAGEVQREQAQERIDDLLERSRRSSEQLVGLIRREVREQLVALGLVPAADGGTEPPPAGPGVAGDPTAGGSAAATKPAAKKPDAPSSGTKPPARKASGAAEGAG